MAIYGGSAIVLTWEFRTSSDDVDVVISGDPSPVRQAARQFAKENGWPEDWLNDAVQGRTAAPDGASGSLESALPQNLYAHCRIPSRHEMHGDESGRSR